MSAILMKPHVLSKSPILVCVEHDHGLLTPADEFSNLGYIEKAIYDNLPL